MPSLALFIQQVLAQKNEHNPNYIYEFENRIDSLNHAQLQGMYDHLLKTSTTSDSKIWRDANKELLVHVKRILDEKNKIIAENNRVLEEKYFKAKKRKDDKAAKLVEEQRALDFIRVNARKKAEQEVLEGVIARETNDRLDMKVRQPIAEKKRLHYIIGGAAFFTISCIIIGVTVKNDSILLGTLIVIIVVVTLYIFWLGYKAGKVVPLVVSPSQIEEAVLIRMEQLAQREIDAWRQKERDYELSDLKEKEERKQKRLEKKQALQLAQKFHWILEDYEEEEEEEKEPQQEELDRIHGVASSDGTRGADRAERLENNGRVGSAQGIPLYSNPECELDRGLNHKSNVFLPMATHNTDNDIESGVSRKVSDSSSDPFRSARRDMTHTKPASMSSGVNPAGGSLSRVSTRTASDVGYETAADQNAMAGHDLSDNNPLVQDLYFDILRITVTGLDQHTSAESPSDRLITGSVDAANAPKVFVRIGAQLQGDQGTYKKSYSGEDAEDPERSRQAPPPPAAILFQTDTQYYSEGCVELTWRFHPVAHTHSHGPSPSHGHGDFPRRKGGHRTSRQGGGMRILDTSDSYFTKESPHLPLLRDEELYVDLHQETDTSAPVGHSAAWDSSSRLIGGAVLRRRDLQLLSSTTRTNTYDRKYSSIHASASVASQPNSRAPSLALPADSTSVTSSSSLPAPIRVPVDAPVSIHEYTVKKHIESGECVTAVEVEVVIRVCK